MSGRAYVDNILEPVVKTWLNKGDDFVLEKNNDSGHGNVKSAQNPAFVWKQNYPELKTLFNCFKLPDLVLIKNCWQLLKQSVNKRPH